MYKNTAYTRRSPETDIGAEHAPFILLITWRRILCSCTNLFRVSSYLGVFFYKRFDEDLTVFGAVLTNIEMMDENETFSFPDFDTRQMDYPMNITSVPVGEAAVKITVYTLLILISLIGNTLIVLVVLKNKRMQTTTNYFLVNLAVSDLVVSLSCSWVNLVEDLTEGWVLGAFFCPFNSFAQGKF